jgi:hypothetical protein
MLRLCAGLIIFTGNENNDQAEDKFQPGHPKESGSVEVIIVLLSLRKWVCKYFGLDNCPGAELINYDVLIIHPAFCVGC